MKKFSAGKIFRKLTIVALGTRELEMSSHKNNFSAVGFLIAAEMVKVKVYVFVVGNMGIIKLIAVHHRVFFPRRTEGMTITGPITGDPTQTSGMIALIGAKEARSQLIEERAQNPRTRDLSHNRHNRVLNPPI